MTTTLYLTERDQEILQALVQKVRLFSLRQLAGHWWEGDLANARRRLRSLAAAQLLHRVSVQARTLPPINDPILQWQPDDATPNLRRAAYELQSRWHRRSVRSITAFIATDRLAQLYGGRCRGELRSPLQATHDLGVSAVWLRLRHRVPGSAQAWCSEDLMAHTRRGEKLPDAFLLGDQGEVTGVVEFGGSYDLTRVEEFHDDCAARGLPYQIW